VVPGQEGLRNAREGTPSRRVFAGKAEGCFSAKLWAADNAAENCLDFFYEMSDMLCISIPFC